MSSACQSGLHSLLMPWWTNLLFALFWNSNTHTHLSFCTLSSSSRHKHTHTYTYTHTPAHSPLTSCEPASVKRELMISSKLQPGSAVCGSWEMCRSMVFSTSSSDASSSCRRMLALSRKPSRSLWALTSSSKFISFTY